MSLRSPVRQARHWLVALACMLVLPFALVACAGDEGGTGPAPVATLRLRALAPRVAPTDTLTVVAEALDARGRRLVGGATPVGWTSSDTAILAPLGSAQGDTLRVVAQRTGEVRLTASVGSVRDTLTVAVRFADPVALRVVLLPADSLVVGGAVSIAAIPVDSLGRTIFAGPPSVVSSAPAVLEVRPWGGGVRAYAISPGRAELVVTQGALQARVAVRVTAAPRSVFPDTSVLVPGLTRRLFARELPAESYPVALAPERWISLSPEVATVSAEGVVTARATGRATVAAIVGRDTLAALVVVKAAPAPIEYVDVVPRAPCAVARDGGIWCWGSNASGQLGTTELTDRCESFQPFSGAGRSWVTRTVFRCSAIPVRVESAERFRSANGNGGGVCALTEAGTVHCWGIVPGPRRAGEGARISSVPVPIAPDVRAVSIGGGCFLSDAGVVHCWGSALVPMFPGGNRSSEVPAPIASPVRFRQLAAGGAAHLCGVTADDAVYCWGSNYAGSVGVPNSTQQPGCFTACEPLPRVAVPLPTRTRQVTVDNGAASCALDYEGVVRCWGAAFANGRRDSSSVPATIQGAPPLARLVEGTDTPCGLTAAGEAWCWGIGDFATRERAQRILPELTLRTFTSILAATCGIATDGILYCSGQRGYLGDGRAQTDPGPNGLVRVLWQR